MRMDNSQGYSAASFLNESTELEISNVIYKYGEEKASRRIAKAIVEFRNHTLIQSTSNLVKIIESVLKRTGKKHPATKTFQAIRIVVNDELIKLSQVLEQTIGILSGNGRLAVITFHSLEDRIVKQFIHKYSRHKAVPRGLPIPNNKQEKLILKDLSKIKPSSEELHANRRS